MVGFSKTNRDPKELTIGAKFKYLHFCSPPFENRTLKGQNDWMRLFSNMQETGKLINPLIVFRDCVLIGQRRCEIAQILNWSSVPCWEITTDISDDRQPDRVYELRDLYKKVIY